VSLALAASSSTLTPRAHRRSLTREEPFTLRGSGDVISRTWRAIHAWCGDCSSGVMTHDSLGMKPQAGVARMPEALSNLSVAGFFRFLRAGVAGLAATGVDLGVLALLVSGFHVDPRVASLPALVLGGVANFVGNRHFAFRAQGGSLPRQALLYTLVEVAALTMNGVLYDLALRLIPNAPHAYVLVRIVTSHLVFLCWSYPLWRRVFTPWQPIRST
jgi:putative flippase GtrA